MKPMATIAEVKAVKRVVEIADDMEEHLVGED